MFKKILKYFTIAVLGAAAALYFFFVSSISAAAGKNEVVRKVDIVIKDSAQLRFLDKDIVRNIYFTKFGILEPRRLVSYNLDVRHLGNMSVNSVICKCR